MTLASRTRSSSVCWCWCWCWCDANDGRLGLRTGPVRPVSEGRRGLSREQREVRGCGDATQVGSPRGGQRLHSSRLKRERRKGGRRRRGGGRRGGRRGTGRSVREQWKHMRVEERAWRTTACSCPRADLSACRPPVRPGRAARLGGSDFENHRGSGASLNTAKKKKIYKWGSH